MFYLIIDRDGDEEMVYFLTEISENDLLNTTTDNSETLPKNSAALESAIPVSDSALPNNNAETDNEETEELPEDGEESTEESTGNRKNSPHSPIIRWEPISCLALLQSLASAQVTISRW